VHVVLQQHIDKCPATLSPDNLPTGQQHRIFERISRIPSEFMGMRGVEHTGNGTASQRFADLPRNGLRFGNFDHRLKIQNIHPSR